MPILNLVKSGKLTGVKHVQLSSCGLDDSGLLTVSMTMAMTMSVIAFSSHPSRARCDGCMHMLPRMVTCTCRVQVILFFSPPKVSTSYVFPLCVKVVVPFPVELESVPQPINSSARIGGALSPVI